jgi:hypothetical protein
MRSAHFHFIFFLLMPALCLAQGEGKAVHRYSNDFEDSLINREWMNSSTIITDSGSHGNHFSRITGANPYSAGMEAEIPADLKQKNFRISVKVRSRMSASSNNQLVISIAKNDSAIFWRGTPLTDSTYKLNEWSPLNISLLIPRSVPAESKIKIFVWNADGRSATDVDDLEISLTEVQIPSFLPN